MFYHCLLGENVWKTVYLDYPYDQCQNIGYNDGSSKCFSSNSIGKLCKYVFKVSDKLKKKLLLLFRIYYNNLIHRWLF